MKKLLILGSKGFIGSGIYSTLKKSYLAYGADINEDNKDSNYFKLEKNFANIEKLLERIKFDFIINCAGSANVQESFVNPKNDFYLNVGLLSPLSSLIIVHQQNCKLINISSAAVYGNPELLPVKVDSFLNPISPYGVHKLLAEKLMLEYSKIFGLSTCSLRIFSAYGEGQKKLFLWDCFQKLTRVAADEKVSFFGTGMESRDFIHISDISRQIELVIQNAPFEGEVYNVANGEEIFIKDVVATMQLAMNNSAEVTFTGTTRPGDPLNWRADISPMHEWGYKKSVSMGEGIKAYVKWVLENV